MSLPPRFRSHKHWQDYADEILGLQGAYEEQDYSGDIGLHFMLSSSLGHTGRLIATIIRLMRPRNCLELGTCYGMRSMCILSMLERNGDFGKLTTVERFDPIYSLAKERLHVAARRILSACFLRRTSASNTSAENYLFV